MNIPSYIVVPVESDQDETDSVITTTSIDEDVCRWEKVVSASTPSPDKSSPRLPRRRLSIFGEARYDDDSSLDKPSTGSKCLPSLPKRRGSIFLEKLILETTDILSLDGSDVDPADDSREDEVSKTKRDSDPPTLPQRRETLLLEEFALNLAELNVFLDDEDDESLNEHDLSFLERETSEPDVATPASPKGRISSSPVLRRSAIRGHDLLAAASEDVVNLMPSSTTSSSASSIISDDNDDDDGSAADLQKHRSSELFPPKQPRRKPSIIRPSGENFPTATATSTSARSHFLTAHRCNELRPTSSFQSSRRDPVPHVSASRST
jgi:hypothetical protein